MASRLLETPPIATEKQRKLFSLIARGLTVKQMAGILGRTEWGLKHTMWVLREILGIENTRLFTVWCRDFLLLPPVTLAECAAQLPVIPDLPIVVVPRRIFRESGLKADPPSATQKQRDLLTLLVAGLNAKQIAARLGCTYGNVNGSLQSMCRTLHFTNQIQLGIFASKFLMHGAGLDIDLGPGPAHAVCYACGQSLPVVRPPVLQQ